MANTVSILSYANTFGDWVVTTNGLVRENNNLAANNYTKASGTLFLNDTSLGLQVANNAIFGGQLQSTGLGSSLSVQNGLTVGGISQLNGTVNVANSVIISSTLTVAGNTVDPVYISAVNNAQNNTITAVNSFAQGAYGVANSASGTATSALSLATTNAGQVVVLQANVAYLQGIENTQNTNTVAVNGYAAGAFALANSAVQTIAGTADEIGVSRTGNAVTLTTPQQIGVISNVQFGSLGIGTGPTGTSGEIRATNNITAYYSDDRLKTRFNNIPNALDKVLQLNGFYHQASELAQSLGYQVVREVGVSAQEVEKVLPEVVAPAPIDDKYLTVRYERLVPLLIEAIKELKSEIDELKAKQ